eukprot:scaffold552419_cov19-Prasinocladus_malaysianus.AAC.1
MVEKPRYYHLTAGPSLWRWHEAPGRDGGLQRLSAGERPAAHAAMTAQVLSPSEPGVLCTSALRSLKARHSSIGHLDKLDANNPCPVVIRPRGRFD